MAETGNKKLIETIFEEAAKGYRALFAESQSGHGGLTRGSTVRPCEGVPDESICQSE
jgi:hypothetical protein